MAQVVATVLESSLSRARETAAAAAPFCDLLEPRLDALAAAPGEAELAAFFQGLPRPAIATCRPRREGGLSEAPDSVRRALLESAARAGAAFVDWEGRSEGTPALPAETLLILSWHDFESSPRDLGPIARPLFERRPHLVKIVTHARSLADNRIPLEWLRSAPGPAAAFCMGEAGLASRVLAGKFGGALTYGSAAESSAAAPGQPPARLLHDLYRVHRIGPSTRVYGLAGDPLGHSRSPEYFNVRFAAQGRDAVYLPLPSGEFAEFLSFAEFIGLGGASVTIPHKASALAAATESDESTRAIAAANTLTLTPAGWRATNTDAPAARAVLEAALAPAGLRDLPCLLLGAGGAARAVAHVLAAGGAKIVIAGRTFNAARLLARTINAVAMPWERAGELPWQLLVNATPVGMWPKTGETPLPLTAVPPGAVVFDLVYNPPETRLLREARALGAKIVPGTLLFECQADLQYQAWFSTG